MEKELKIVMLTLLADKIKAMSWGITNILITNAEIEFNVSGFLYQGKVHIIAKDGVCCISLQGKEIKCSIGEITNTLDMLIERSSNYTSELEAWVKQ